MRGSDVLEGWAGYLVGSQFNGKICHLNLRKICDATFCDALEDIEILTTIFVVDFV
jgi:hypothetical protein